MNKAIYLLAALVPACAHAEMRGVWEGAIGRNKVMLCLGGEGFSGTYYYRRHLGLIRLVHAGKPGEWAEESDGKRSAYWQLKEQPDGTLAGTWSRPGARGIPIRLVRPAGEAASCDGDAFNAPLEAEPRVVRSEEEFDGHRYASLYVDGSKPDIGPFSAVQLLDQGRAAQAINDALKGGFPSDKGSLYQCRRDALAQFGDVGNTSMEQKIVFWNQRLFSVQIDGSENCGGAHPNEGSVHRTWDIATGNELDIKYWFGNAAEGGLPAQVKRIVLARAQGGQDQSCADALEHHGYYQVYPSGQGLMFFTGFNFASRNCDEEILVPYGDILKHLAPEARAALGR